MPQDGRLICKIRRNDRNAKLSGGLFSTTAIIPGDVPVNRGVNTMKHSVLNKVGSAFLIIGLACALPAYAEMQGGHEAMGMAGKGEPGTQQMSGMMNDMSDTMKNMSGMMGGGSMSPDMMKKMSSQMKQMGRMMNNMSGMMKKMSGMKNMDMTMDAGMQKKMGQMRKQMDQMHKDMPASPALK
jgi:uncharacterized membrane protein YdfJ with MMPL/SSD domain